MPSYGADDLVAAKDSTRKVGLGILPRVDRWWVYIAKCSDNTLYVGIARNVTTRIAQHDAGRGARYTRGRTPLQLLAKRRCPNQGDALRLERALKRLPRPQKLEMAASRRKLARLATGCARSEG